MRYLLTFLTLIAISPATPAQRVHKGDGGAPPESGMVTAPVRGMSRAGKTVHPGEPSDRLMKPASPNHAGDLTRISSLPFQEPDATYRSYSESCPFVLGNGDLLVVYANPDRDTLYAVRSANSGTTWDPPSFVCSSTNSLFRSLAGIRTVHGRILVVWAASPLASATGRGLSMCSTDDDGATWSAPTTIAPTPGDSYPTISQTLDGTIWLCYGRTNIDTGIGTFCRTSTDNGSTWSTDKTLQINLDGNTYATVVSKDSSTIILIDVEFAPVSSSIPGSDNILSRTSTNGGATWSAASMIANASLDEERPRAFRQSDGTLWLVYQHYKSSAGGQGQSEIAYKKSTDGGITWSTVSFLTHYAGYDGWLNACMLGNQPFVTFASCRWCPLLSQTRLWYGLIGTSTDVNPPPALMTCSPVAPAANSTEIIRAYVADEAAISSVQLSYHFNGVPYAPVQMYDDGAHGDYAAHDGVYGASLGPFQAGDCVDLSIEIRDVNSNVASVYVNNAAVPALHNAGNMILTFSANSELGTAYWPKSGGDGYLFDGGLWVGCNVGGQDVVVKQFYGLAKGWSRTYGSSFSLAPGISDQDGNVTYDDVTAYTAIGLQVHQRSYQWAHSTWGDFVIFTYTVTNNGSNGTLNKVYAGLWTDPDIGGRTDPTFNAAGYDSLRHMVYTYNTQNTPRGYFGVKLLGAGAVPSSVYSWLRGQLNETTGMPFYRCLTHGGTTLPDSAGDVRMLLTASPFSLVPNASTTVQFGLVLGNGLSGLQANADTMEAVFESKLAISVEPPTAGNAIPKEFSLSQNYPNPFNPGTTIKYGVPRSSVVRLTVHDLLGREVSVLVNERKDAGVHEVRFDGSNLASGVYFYRLQAGTFAQARTFLLLK